MLFCFFLAVLRGLLQSLYVVINIADNPLEFVNNNIYNITDIENPKETGFIVVVGSKYASQVITTLKNMNIKNIFYEKDLYREVVE